MGRGAGLIRGSAQPRLRNRRCGSCGGERGGNQAEAGGEIEKPADGRLRVPDGQARPTVVRTAPECDEGSEADHIHEGQTRQIEHNPGAGRVLQGVGGGHQLGAGGHIQFPAYVDTDGCRLDVDGDLQDREVRPPARSHERRGRSRMGDGLAIGGPRTGAAGGHVGPAVAPIGLVPAGLVRGATHRHPRPRGDRLRGRLAPAPEEQLRTVMRRLGVKRVGVTSDALRTVTECTRV